jgi:hypothetical protein
MPQVGYPRIADSFTVAKWEEAFATIERLGTYQLGRGVIEGLVMSDAGGLDIDITAGKLAYKAPKEIGATTGYEVPDNATSYIWMSELGVITTTVSSTDPGGGLVCLGKVIASAANITSVSNERTDGRMEIGHWVDARNYAIGPFTIDMLTDTVDVDGTLVVNELQVDVALVLPEQGSNPANAANKAKLFAKEAEGSITELFGLDSAGNATQLTRGGELALWSGIPDYSSTHEYVAGNIVLGSDGNAYRALATTTGDDPTTDGGDDWELWYAWSDITLMVETSGGRFATPWAALDFVKNARFPQAFITIDVGAGTYTKTTAWGVDHPDGGQIAIIGNGSTGGSKTTLSFTNHTEGIVVGTADPGAPYALGFGRSLGRLDGVLILGTWNPAGAGGSGANGYARTGVFASYGSSIRCGSDVAVDDFYYGFGARERSSIVADSTDVTDCGDAGYIAVNGGYISAVDTTVTTAADAGSSLGNGYVSESGGAMLVSGANATACKYFGFLCSGHMHARTAITASSQTASTGTGICVRGGGSLSLTGGATASSNGLHGIWVDRGGSLDSYGTITCASNTSYGIYVSNGRIQQSGTTTVGGSGTANANGIGVFYGASAFFSGTVTVSYNTTNGILVSHGSSLSTTGAVTASNCTNGINVVQSTFVFDGNVTCNSNSAYGLRGFGGKVLRNAGTLTCKSNTTAGVYADSNSEMDIRACVIGATGEANGTGIIIAAMSSVFTNTGSITYNTSYGVSIASGGKCFATSANVNNNNGGGAQCNITANDDEQLPTAGGGYYYAF